jgi:beta-glucosidase
MIDRRTVLAGCAATLAAAPALAQGAAQDARFPDGFLWGAATAGHQVEGNNVNADCWLLENVSPTIFAEPSLDADNSFELWATDLDLAKALGLNACRFSLEWARIEPIEGAFSIAMLDHYKAVIEGCRARGMTPVVTFNHFTTPRWFAAKGGWTNAAAPGLFARFCDRAARHLGAGIGYATTLNEPNLLNLLFAGGILPPAVIDLQRAMLAAAAKASGSASFAAGNAIDPADMPAATRHLVAAHKAGRAAIKAVRPDLPVGLSLAMFDDQAAGKESIRDAMREKFYQPWLDVVKDDDFLGVQNYERKVWSATGLVPTPTGVPVNYSGSEVYPLSLAGAVRYAHQATGVPIFVTEHGVGTDDDTIRARLIPAALRGLRQAMGEGVPVIGYCHWSLIDNYEWISGFKVHFGLHSVDRATFARTPRPSTAVYADIVRRNAV